MMRIPEKHHIACYRIFVFVGAAITCSTLAVAQGTFSKPGLITSVGQSSDIAIVKALLNTKLRLGLDAKPLATAADFGSARTLVLVLGSSAKGLGAAGINMDQEIERTKNLLKAAKEKGISILALHVGGESKRGKSSNDLIELVIPDSQHVVVIETGNKDKLFNNLASRRGIPVSEVPNLAAAGDAIKSLFKE